MISSRSRHSTHLTSFGDADRDVVTSHVYRLMTGVAQVKFPPASARLGRYEYSYLVRDEDIRAEIATMAHRRGLYSAGEERRRTFTGRESKCESMLNWGFAASNLKMLRRRSGRDTNMRCRPERERGGSEVAGPSHDLHAFDFVCTASAHCLHSMYMLDRNAPD